MIEIKILLNIELRLNPEYHSQHQLLHYNIYNLLGEALVTLLIFINFKKLASTFQLSEFISES